MVLDQRKKNKKYEIEREQEKKIMGLAPRFEYV